MSLTCFQIVKIPDLTLNKYVSLADTGIEGVLARHRNFLRQWHGICKTSGTSFHLLYVFVPDDVIGTRLKLYFIIQGEDKIVKDMLPLLMKSPLSDFYEFVPCKLPEHHFSACSTLIKAEAKAPIYNQYSGSYKDFHYVPGWEMNGSARLYDLFKTMETIGDAYDSKEPCAYRVDLYPVHRLDEIREAFIPAMKELQGENGIQLVKEINYSRRDNYTQNVLNEYEDWLKKAESTPLFAVNIYGLAQNDFLSHVILNSVGSEAVSEGDFHIEPNKVDEKGYFTLTSRLDVQAKSYCKSANPVYRNWATTYTLEEAEAFFRLPALYEGENIELPKETKPIISETGIQLGEDENGYTVMYNLEDLPRHAFFTGMPGSGKTNTMLHLVSELVKKEIPFLVMEPAKKEYRNLLTNPEMKNVYLFSPHLQSHFPLKMNPFEFPIGVQLSEHIKALLEVFQGSFELAGNVYTFLSNSIEQAYKDLGWDIEEKNTGELEYPTFKEVEENIKKEIKKSTYAGEIQGNAEGYLQVRLASLMTRDAGELFYTSTSTISPERWVDISAIVELETLDEKAKNFFVLLVLHYIRQSLKSDPSGGKDKNGELKPTRHVLFIEEAHNIIASTTEQPGETVDPKISATKYIKDMLAEVRALREAIIIADQIPTALTPEVVKNTGLKIVHRLTSQDDREVIGTAINSNPVQIEQMATFSRGKSLIYHESTQKPFIVQISEYKKPKVDFNYSIDEELYEHLKDNPTVVESVNALLMSFNMNEAYEIEVQLDHIIKELDQLNGNNEIDLMETSVNLNIFVHEVKKMLNKMERFNALYDLENDKYTERYHVIVDRLQLIHEEMSKRSKILEQIIKTIKNNKKQSTND